MSAPMMTLHQAHALLLARIGFLVDERSARQDEAVRSVQRASAGEQTLIGPLLQRQCTEE